MVRVFSHQIAIVAITCARFGDYSRRSLVLGPHTLKVPSSDPETSTFGWTGFHVTQLTAKEWPVSSAMGVSHKRWYI